MLIDILSLFPSYFKGPFEESMIGRARKKGLLQINLHNIRDFTEDKHRRVDDKPYGGGAGMVMKPDPVAKAIRHARKEKGHVIYLTPRAKVVTAQKARDLAKLEHMVLLCGHYEGIDERVIKSDVDEEISIGDYVLTNGCIAAIVLLDLVMRFIPGFLGNSQAADDDSFENGLLDWEQYTRPENFEGWKVPQVLLSGNHQEIRKWREENAYQRTSEKRKDLIICQKKV